MSSESSAFDPYTFLQIVPNSDGTITRDPDLFLSTSPTPDPDSAFPVLSKDFSINRSTNTWVRVFLPRQAPDRFPTKKLPLVVYYHGGGFIICSAASTLFHNFCADLAAKLHIVIASVDYRLAPEHRLPAAYDDGLEALQWIETSQDDWIKNHVDLSNCYLMGLSSGGNLAYHVALRRAVEANHLDLLKIRGLILHQPFFGGSQRTGSELRLMNDSRFPLAVSDLMWELCLPVGVDRDHEYCNPTVNDGSKVLVQIKRLGWRVLVTGCDGDPLIDRQIELVKLMEKKDLEVVGHFFAGGYHGVELLEPPFNPMLEELLILIKSFISRG